MKPIQLLLPLFFVSFFQLNAQTEVILKGTVYDTNTGQPLPYVNIGILDRSIGTVTDEDGEFKLRYKPYRVSENDIVQISFIGYQSRQFGLREFEEFLRLGNNILLTPKAYELGEVVIGDLSRRKRSLGTLRKDTKTIGYWLNKEALGGEIATKFSISKKNTQLHSLKFRLVKNNSGSIKIRVNVYDINKEGFPGENLLNENIYFTLFGMSEQVSIDLEPYNIFVDQDIIVSIELVKVFGNYIDFEVAGSTMNGTSFTRELSQASWKRYANQGMAFKLVTSYPSSKKKGDDELRDLPSKISLYWDTSLKMKDKNIDKELELLKAYFKKVNNAIVELIEFNRTTKPSQTFYVVGGEGEALIDHLEQISYNGIKSYSSILQENPAGSEVVLVFTDGESHFDELDQRVYLPTFYISSKADANHMALQDMADYSDGHYINLTQHKLKTALHFMTKNVEDILQYDESFSAEGEVYGSVFLAGVPIQGAKITVKNKNEEVRSDALGNYRINAEQGDIIEARILDNFKTVRVINNERLNIDLQPEGEVLKEVLLKAEVERNKEIETPYGFKDEKALGYNIDEISSDEISSSYQNLDQIVARLPGVLIQGIGTEKRYLFPRTMNSSFELEAEPIIVIDGIIYQQDNGLDNLPPIDLQRIKSVQAIKGVAGTNRYGSLGAYGAIVIKTDLTDKREDDVAEEEPSLLAENNTYNEELPLFNEQLPERPDYIKRISQTSSVDEARKTYFKLRESHLNSFEFYLDMADYFQKTDRDFALDVLSNLALISMNNSRGLKILAYKFEEFGDFQAAHTVYKKILKKEQNNAQAYRDLAQSYINIKEHQKAFDLYVAMLSEQLVEADFSEMMGTITAEFQNLIKQYGNLFDLKNIPDALKDPQFKRDIRIVMEWTDPNMEFDLQFVDPGRKFFKWKHTKLDSKERMITEVTKGFSSESFDIDDSDKGLWLVNIENLDDSRDNIPNYIKYTIYRNYGLPSERKLSKLIRLSDIKQKVTLDKFQFPVIR